MSRRRIDANTIQGRAKRASTSSSLENPLKRPANQISQGENLSKDPINDENANSIPQSRADIQSSDTFSTDEGLFTVMQIETLSESQRVMIARAARIVLDEQTESNTAIANQTAFASELVNMIEAEDDRDISTRDQDGSD